VEVVIGVERLAMVLQGANSVYEVESLPQLFSALEEDMGKNAVQGIERERQMRLMADHLRAMLFLVADGAPPPGRGGRARIMRRLARNSLTAQKLLDLPVSGGKKLSPAVSAMLDHLINFYQAEHSLPGQTSPRMLAAHPRLSTASGILLGYLEQEALLFEKTVQLGLCKLDQILTSRSKRCLSGREMLELEISDGIPIAYLVYTLDQKKVDYLIKEYNVERAKWQKSTARGRSSHNPGFGRTII
jgi:alanyl-tRNA synthetase